MNPWIGRVSPVKPMAKEQQSMFSEPELKTEPAFGFRSVFVTIEVSDVEATPSTRLLLPF